MARKATSTKSIVSGTSLPVFNTIKKKSKTFERDFRVALYYVHYEINYKTLKTETIKYAKSVGLYNKALDANPDYAFSVIGKACYVYNRGGELPDEWEDGVNKRINELIETGKVISSKNKETVDTVKKVVNIQERLKEHAAMVASEFDGFIDKFLSSPKSHDVSKFDPYSVMLNNGIKMAHARWIIKFYENDYNDVKLAVNGGDKDIVEAYSFLNKTELKKLLKIYERILSSANMIIESSSANRKPRKKKRPDLTKMISKLKYKKEDPSLSLVSINPIEIIGAKVLWVYNTKTRKIGKYIAADYDGLSVKGTSIKGFDPEKSIEKTLRKPQEQLKEFKKAGKVKLRKFMDEIKTIDIKLKGRINEHHILLRVDK